MTVQCSSSEFFHFLRLMQLFPEVHPATLHTVMTMCQNNFLAAVDRLLYAKKCKELHNRRNHYHQQICKSRTARFHPYSCNNSKSTIKTEDTEEGNDNSNFIMEHNFSSEVLDIAKCKFVC